MRSLAAVFAAFSLLVVGSAAQQPQVVVQEQGSGRHGLASASGSGHPLEASADTLTSALSASDQHSTLIRLLQRAKCIPMLSHIGSATLFAPTNDAWDEWFKQHTPEGSDQLYQGWLGSEGLSAWLKDEDEVLASRIARGGLEEDEVRKMDNQNWALRQHLLYHMLNYTLPASALLADGSTNITTETTLLFPLAEEPQLPPIPEPGSPWLPQGGQGMLGGHGQRLRVARAGSEEGGRHGKIGVDFDGSGGVEIWDGKVWREPEGNGTDKSGQSKESRVHGAKWVRNGVVIGVNGVIDPPPSIDKVINSHPSLSYLSKLLESSSPLPSPIPKDLSSSPHLTIFAPEDQAFHGAFDEVERGYLEGGFGAEGVGRIFSGGVILGVGKGDKVGWRDAWGSQENDIASVSGLGLAVQAPEGGGLVVNGTNVTVVDIFASNGVLHIIPNLLLPENFTLLNTAEKVLLSVNATRFVSLLRSANLSSTYVGQPGTDAETERPWTILAPRDDVFEMMDRWGGHGIPMPPSWQTFSTSDPSDPASVNDFNDCSPLGALLQYHILPGRLTAKEIRDRMLVGTEMRTPALKGARQRLRIDVSETFKQSRGHDIAEGEIRFGGATVLGAPVRSGKSIIYLLSAVLSPPDDVLQTAVSDLQLSTFIAAVYAGDLDKSFKKTPGVSYFVPRNRAFAQMGLGMKYLLLAEGKDELRKVLRYHAVDEILYTDDIETGRMSYKTLEAGKIVLNRTTDENSTLTLSSPSKWEGHDSGASFPANGELRPAKVWHTDALTETGVLHTIDSVMVPADVRLTIGKLIRGAKQVTFADLMLHAGLEWILQSREPTSDEVSRAQLDGVVHSTIVDEEQPPTDIESLAMPSYTVLVPTDKAFSKINLTQYLSDRDALLELLKLHIIPTQAHIPRTAKTKIPAVPPRDGQPLSLADDLLYPTLLSSQSKYGDLAIRATGDNSFMVGIRGARGNIGHTSARLGASGRASVRWKSANAPELSARDGNDDPDRDDPNKYQDDLNLELWKGGMTLGGGVFLIDSVLVPFQPNWFDRWGWVVIAFVGTGVVLLIGGAAFTWWWLARGKEEYEPLEGEEED